MDSVCLKPSGLNILVKNARGASTKTGNCPFYKNLVYSFISQFSLYFKTVYVMYQTLAQVFDHVSKHREQKLKNKAQPSFLTKVRGVWKHETLVRVFDTTSQTNTYFTQEKMQEKAWLISASILEEQVLTPHNSLQSLIPVGFCIVFVL